MKMIISSLFIMIAIIHAANTYQETTMLSHGYIMMFDGHWAKADAPYGK